MSVTRPLKRTLRSRGLPDRKEATSNQYPVTSNTFAEDRPSKDHHHMPMHLVSPFSGLDDVVAENVPLAPYTWYKIGGLARWYVRPRNPEELQESAGRCLENDIPIYVLGLGANLLVG